jgi:hypothetical protein
MVCLIAGPKHAPQVNPLLAWTLVWIADDSYALSLGEVSILIVFYFSCLHVSSATADCDVRATNA